jgi:hypothetical protein
MDYDRLAAELTAAYESFKRASGEREKQRQFRYFTGMCDAVAALARQEQSVVIFEIMASVQSGQPLASALKGMMH